jgi:hypothetical protein
VSYILTFPFGLANVPKDVVQRNRASSDIRTAWCLRQQSYGSASWGPRNQPRIRNVRRGFNGWGGKFLGCTLRPASGRRSPVPSPQTTTSVIGFYHCEWHCALSRYYAGIDRNFLTVYQATAFGNACPQQNYTLPYIPDLNYTALASFVSKVNASEDCKPLFLHLQAGHNEIRNLTKSLNASGLYANVFRPAGVTEKSKLPVVVVSTCVILNDSLRV